MIGKAVCLLVVLIIAAHAAETDTEWDSDVALAEVGSQVDVSAVDAGALKGVHDTFSMSDADYDEQNILDYEDEEGEKRRRRADRARRRREKRRRERRARRKALRERKKQAKRARRQAKKLTRKVKKAIKKLGNNATAKNVAAVVFPAINRTANGTNGTNATNITYDPIALARQMKLARLTKKDLAEYKKIRKLEKEAKKHLARAKVLEAQSKLEAARKKARRESLKRKIRAGRTDWAVRQGIDAIKSIQSEFESEDIKEDRRFWDQYYGRKRVVGRGDKQPKKMDAKRVAAPTEEAKPDMAMPLYKASHIASFKEAYAQSKKIKQLDIALKSDGDKYLEFARTFA